MPQFFGTYISKLKGVALPRDHPFSIFEYFYMYGICLLSKSDDVKFSYSVEDGNSALQPRGAKILPCGLIQANSRDIFFSPNGDRTGTTG